MRCAVCGAFLYAELASAGMRSINGYLLPKGAFKPQFHVQSRCFAYRRRTASLQKASRLRLAAPTRSSIGNSGRQGPLRQQRIATSGLDRLRALAQAPMRESAAAVQIATEVACSGARPKRSPSARAPKGLADQLTDHSRR
jgi:hypothetical protein